VVFERISFYFHCDHCDVRIKQDVSFRYRNELKIKPKKRIGFVHVDITICDLAFHKLRNKRLHCFSGGKCIIVLLTKFTIRITLCPNTDPIPSFKTYRHSSDYSNANFFFTESPSCQNRSLEAFLSQTIKKTCIFAIFRLITTLRFRKSAFLRSRSHTNQKFQNIPRKRKTGHY
jgi:hypothetical protein